MSNLIPATDKALYNAAVTDIHDTFKRSITVFKESKRIVVATNPAYSNIYQRSRQKDSVTTEAVPRTMDARIFYFPKEQDLQTLNLTNTDLRLDISNANVRIKVTAEDFAFLDGVERYEIDGHPFRAESSARPHGIIDSEFYTLILKRLD